MAQYQEGQRLQGSDGKTYVVRNGVPVSEAPAQSFANPKLPFEVQQAQGQAAAAQFAAPNAQANLQGQGLTNQRTAQDITLDRGKAMASLAQQFANDVNVKTYRTALPEMAKAMRAGEGKQGDINVVYSFAKVMDPGSVVREGEINFANASASLIQRVQQYVDMINKGKGLQREVRNGLIDEMRSAVAEYDRGYIGVRQQYEGLAQQSGFDPSVVLGKHPGDQYRPVEMQYLQKAGKLKTSVDPKASAVYDQMFRNGASYEDVAALAQQIGAAAPDRAQYEKALAARNAGAPVGSASVLDVSSTNAFNQLANSVAGPKTVGFTKGLKHSFDRAATGLEHIANTLPGIDSNSAEAAQANSDQMFSGLPSNQTAETVGRLTGAGVISAPLRGPMIAGAVGNMLMGDSTDAPGLTGEGVLGAAGGKLGDVAIRGLSNLIAPRLPQALRNLGQQGYRASPGQLFGRQARNLEDRLTANPVLGPRIDAIRDEGLAQINRIPANRALGHLGQTLPDNVPAGHAAVDHVRTQAGNAYDNALNGQTIGLDPTFVTRLNTIGARARLRPQEMDELGEIVQRELGGAFQENGSLPGSMSGRGYKELDERLNDMVSGFGRSDDPYRRQLGNALGDVRDQMRALARRQSPNMAHNLRAADEAYADYSILRRAAQANPTTGIATPGQFRTAVRQNDRSVGKGATARGQARMQDFAADASEAVPSTIGSSGTSEREQVNKLAPWVIGSALSPLYSDTAVNLLNRTMLRNPDPVSQFVAERLRALPRGMFGAGPSLLIGSGQ